MLSSLNTPPSKEQKCLLSRHHSQRNCYVDMTSLSREQKMLISLKTCTTHKGTKMLIFLYTSLSKDLKCWLLLKYSSQKNLNDDFFQATIIKRSTLLTSLKTPPIVELQCWPLSLDTTNKWTNKGRMGRTWNPFTLTIQSANTSMVS